MCLCMSTGSQVVNIVDAKVWQSQRMGMVGCLVVLRPRLTRLGPDSSAEARPPLPVPTFPNNQPDRAHKDNHTNHMCVSPLLMPHHVWRWQVSITRGGQAPNPPKHLATPPLTPAPSASPNSTAQFLNSGAGLVYEE